MEEDHPILDGPAHHLGQVLRVRPGEPRSGASVLELPLDLAVLLRRRGLLRLPVRFDHGDGPVRVPEGHKIERPFEPLGSERLLESQQLFVGINRPEHLDRFRVEPEPGQVLVGPGHEQLPDQLPLMLVGPFDRTVEGLLVDGDNPLVRIECHPHPLGPILHRVTSVQEDDQGPIEQLPNEAPVALPAAHVRGEDRLAVRTGPDIVGLQLRVLEWLDPQFDE